MSLILRGTKGSRLTISEMDGNFTYLDNKSGIIEMVYSDLIDAIDNDLLIPGQNILLTDYQTVHYIQYSGPSASGIGNEEVNIGATESLLLTAISTNTLNTVATSPAYPQDTIIYYHTMTDREYDYCSSQGKGCIIYRKDNLLNVSRDYDYRSVIFRRWETAPENGLFYSWLPISGSSYIDTLAFGSSIGTIRRVNISSALNISGEDDYWLDNTIFNYFQTLVDINFCIAYQNTFYGSIGLLAQPLMVEFDANQTAGNIVVQPYVALNYFGDFVNNTIINTTEGNYALSANSVNGCAGNNLTGFFGNTVTTVDGNTGNIIAYNTSITIANNLIDDISANNVTFIFGNTTSSEILSNSGARIENNTVAIGISNNVVDLISSNLCQYITGNIADSITANTVSLVNINGNIATEIDQNSNTGSISFNTVNETISLNGNIGDINNNTLSKILSVTGTGSIDSLSGNTLDTININGNFKNSFNVNMTDVTITSQIDNTTFNGNIASLTITPTSNMQSSTPSIVKYDEGISQFVEERLISGSLTYSTAITS